MSAEQKMTLAKYISEAVMEGARLKKACEIVGISVQSFSRWRRGRCNDNRKGATKKVPRKLTQEEVEKFYKIANSPEYRDLTPYEIVVTLLEKGSYIGSISTLYRILRAKKALFQRTETKHRGGSRKPDELIASGPNQVWCWDITWIKTDVKGLFFYAYVVMDLYSRKIVGWAIEEYESATLAKKLFQKIVSNMKIVPAFVHSDNGSPMKGITFTEFLAEMNISISYSRPRVSNDNPFIESLFKTVKFKVNYPEWFSNIENARIWFADFVNWYNTEHRHSGINYVTPEQRHLGKDKKILEIRQDALNDAARRNPNRFVNGPKKIVCDSVCVLNPVKSSSEKK